MGAWLVQTAAASSLGTMIVRLGRHCGFRTLNIVRREAQAAQLRALGADHVEVSDGSEGSEAALASRLRSICGASGVQFAVDAVGGPLGSAVIQSLGPAGRMLAFGTLSGLPLKFSPRTLMTVGSSVEGFWLGNFMARQGLLFKLGLVRRLTNLIQQNVLSTEIGGTWAPQDIQAAVTAAEDSQVHGKCLLQFSR